MQVQVLLDLLHCCRLDVVRPFIHGQFAKKIEDGRERKVDERISWMVVVFTARVSP